MLHRNLQQFLQQVLQDDLTCDGVIRLDDGKQVQSAGFISGLAALITIRGGIQ
ncbi:MAG: hypothetical protein ABW140_17645 [Candidatus Sedimenticola sp. 6PFRAG1]